MAKINLQKSRYSFLIPAEGQKDAAAMVDDTIQDKTKNKEGMDGKSFSVATKVF